MPSRIARLPLLLLALSIPLFAQSQHSYPSADYAGPARFDLSGLWDFRLDPERKGEAEQWFSPQAFARTSAWRKIAVPGSWNETLAIDADHPAQTDTLRFLQGLAWYRTSFDTPRGCDGGPIGSVCLLHLSGTVLRHTVWVNGRLAGHSDRPYLDEAYNITPLLKAFGTNTLSVEVDNSIENMGIPDRNWHGWWDDGGLIRPVYLEIRPPVASESHVETTMREGGGWQLGIATSVTWPAHQQPIEVRYLLEDANRHAVWREVKSVSAGTPTLRSTAILPRVQAWSPEHPTLYTLTTQTSAGHRVDRTTVSIGFRQIETRGTQIYLNGEPYWLRGISRHQFLAGAGMSLTAAQDWRDIADIKSLGANFVRLAHYTQSQNVYDACDRLGLLVWTEIPAWQSQPASLADSAVWDREARPQLQGMVEQHRNHPSVVIWSVANEIPSELPEGAGFIAKAIAYVKSLDPTRLVTFASDRRLTDRSFGSVDLIAVNEYFGWYYGTQQDVGPMLDALHLLYPEKPILVSEFGADGVAGWSVSDRTPQGRDYSYAAQDAFLRTHLQQIFAPERRNFVAGGLTWLYNDFPDPNRLGGDHPVSANFRNNKGIVTMERSQKPAYATLKQFFHSLP